MDMYVDGNIESNWPQTQNQNGSPVPLSVFTAILNGHGNLFGAAQTEYLANPSLSPLARIAVFGHTHQPMLSVYPQEGMFTGIYANTGSWVNQDTKSYGGNISGDVRTFVVITPGKWSGSDLDVVSLYQYNPVTSGTGYEAVLLAEESIETGQ
jgi:predicted phosphodiesterase